MMVSDEFSAEYKYGNKVLSTSSRNVQVLVV